MTPHRHWSLEDIDFSRFDPGKLDLETVQAVKAAALVEFNAADYVTYLRKVFGEDGEIMPALERWGQEEIQHGAALAAWAKHADPSFDFEMAFQRFRAGYHLPFDVNGSVRGSKVGEMIARCVVESGTSSYYSAIRDATEEPVLKQIAAFIAADEFRHYRLFYECSLKCEPQAQRHLLNRLLVALGRVQESEDDELAYAYYCANVAGSGEAYNRARYSREYNRRVLRFYQPHHIQKAVAMIAKAIGFRPHAATIKVAGNVMWWIIQARGRMGHAAGSQGA
jgi:hypothetical protein